MRKRVIGAAALCTAVLAFPVAAQGARIELSAAELRYTAGPGEANNPLLQRFQEWFYLQESAGPATERVPPCEPSPEPGGLGVTSRCPAGSVSRGVIDLGDGDDFGNVDQNTLLFIPVTVSGGPGRDHISTHSLEGNVLDGGPGDDVIASEVLFPTSAAGPGDTVLGGDGDDAIATRNNRRDVIRCGAGNDSVIADDLDEVAADCETVSLPAATPWGRSDGRPVGVTINNGATFSKNRRLRLTIRAPDVATAVRVSSDPGFGDAVLLTPRKNEKYRFELSPSGTGQSVRTVYVRFVGPGLDPARTFSDDIVLDEKRPNLRSARTWRRAGGRVKVALTAHDAGSGVEWVQLARVRSRPWRGVTYGRSVTVHRVPHWARVCDGAGNASSWRRITR